LDCVTHLHRVAVAFLYSQQQRHTADYDKATRWDRAEALALISQVESELNWRAIRDEPAAHAYLISLLGNPKVG
jgi:hypothetical protein